MKDHRRDKNDIFCRILTGKMVDQKAKDSEIQTILYTRLL